MLKTILLAITLLLSTNLESNEKHLKNHSTKSYMVKGVKYNPIKDPKKFKQTGLASWYGEESGNITASGARFNPNAMTAAHKTLPLNSLVKVTNLKNSRTLTVLVNDRGPYKNSRIIDLSRGAAKRLGIDGVGKVEIEFLKLA